MALEHRVWPMFGVQFHPESVLTQCGHRLLANFLERAGCAASAIPTGDALGSEVETPNERPADEWPPSGPLAITW